MGGQVKLRLPIVPFGAQVRRLAQECCCDKEYLRAGVPDVSCKIHGLDAFLRTRVGGFRFR